MRHALAACLCLAGLFAASAQAADETPDEAELARMYGDKSMVTIVTGTKVPASRAPAAATVITAKDIEAMGATDLDQVLETVPGLHVSRLQIFAGTPIYVVRGIYTRYNPQVLMLVNGVPITSIHLGNRGEFFLGMPVSNIARIDVLRGPGSALYGADAFAAVINIQTKTATDMAGTEAGVQLGAFGTRDGWVTHGSKWGPIDAAMYFRAGHTDGPKRLIESDAQTLLDAAFGTHASLAPGVIDLGLDSQDAQLDLSLDKWRFHVAYKRRRDADHNALASALTTQGRSAVDRITSDLQYVDPSIAPNWGLDMRASVFDYSLRPENVQLFPPGAFGGAFPDGVFGTPERKERNYRFDASLLYEGFKDHRIRLGVGQDHEGIYETSETKNFTLTFFPGVGYVPTPLGSIVNSTPEDIYMTPHSRAVSHLYVQDEWALAPDWGLTAGVRHDRYSDVGGTTNPRVALVWNMSYDLTARLQYGRAFRAPSFAELYILNNPVVLGNPNLKPETIGMTEAGLVWNPGGQLQARASVFQYHWVDILRFTPNADPSTGTTANNAGTQRGRGLELEAAWTPNRRWRLAGNYAFQRSVDEMTGEDAGMAPHHHLNLSADWHFRPAWSLNSQLNWVAGRKREPGDARPPVADYRTVDLTVRHQSDESPWGLTVALRNIFNADVREPSPAPGLIPNHYPLARRNLTVEVRYRF